MSAAQYMWRLLAASWAKRGVVVDPLQCTMEFRRAFPIDEESEARVVQALISAGLPKEIAYSRFSWVDDPSYIMDIIENEKDNISLYESFEKDNEFGEEQELEDDEQLEDDEKDAQNSSNES